MRKERENQKQLREERDLNKKFLGKKAKVQGCLVYWELLQQIEQELSADKIKGMLKFPSLWKQLLNVLKVLQIKAYQVLEQVQKANKEAITLKIIKNQIK